MGASSGSTSSGESRVVMDSKLALAEAVPWMAESLSRACLEAGIRPADLDLVIPHQGSQAMINGLRTRLEPGGEQDLQQHQETMAIRPHRASRFACRNWPIVGGSRGGSVSRPSAGDSPSGPRSSRRIEEQSRRPASRRRGSSKHPWGGEHGNSGGSTAGACRPSKATGSPSCSWRTASIEAQRITYAELDEKARAVAARLQEIAEAGERALLIYPAGLDFLVGLFGCLYAGLIGIPTPPPEASRLKRTGPGSTPSSRTRGLLWCSRHPGSVHSSSRPSPSIFGELPLRWLATDCVDPSEAGGLARPPDRSATTWRTCSTRPAPPRSPRA